MHSTDEHHISKGDSEGTPPRARASKTGQSSSADPFFLRGFRARGFPPVPALPSSSLDGKEGVNGSSPLEGFEELPVNRAVVCPSRKRPSRAGTRGHYLVFPR